MTEIRGRKNSSYTKEYRKLYYLAHQEEIKRKALEYYYKTKRPKLSPEEEKKFTNELNFYTQWNADLKANLVKEHPLWIKTQIQNMIETTQKEIDRINGELSGGTKVKETDT